MIVSPGRFLRFQIAQLVVKKISAEPNLKLCSSLDPSVVGIRGRSIFHFLPLIKRETHLEPPRCLKYSSYSLLASVEAMSWIVKSLIAVFSLNYMR